MICSIYNNQTKETEFSTSDGFINYLNFKMTARSILQVFDHYQKARIQFVQTVADLALRQQNIEYLDQAGALGNCVIIFSDISDLLQSLIFRFTSTTFK